jgi:hypothetical protein
MPRCGSSIDYQQSCRRCDDGASSRGDQLFAQRRSVHLRALIRPYGRRLIAARVARLSTGMTIAVACRVAGAAAWLTPTSEFCNVRQRRISSALAIGSRRFGRGDPAQAAIPRQTALSMNTYVWLLRGNIACVLG